MAGEDDDDSRSRKDDSSDAPEPKPEPAESIMPALDVAHWLLDKNFLLAAYEFWFELEDARDAADPTEPQARKELHAYFKDNQRFPVQELASFASQDGASSRQEQTGCFGVESAKWVSRHSCTVAALLYRA